MRISGLSAKVCLRAGLALCFTGVLLSLTGYAADVAEKTAWPQFRGPNGSGSAEARLPESFGPTENLLWKVTTPKGLSSPVVWGDHIYFTAFENGKLFTLCYALKDGKELWRKQAQASEIEAHHKTEGSPAASSCATDGKHVVAYFGSCGLICYSPSGDELWKVSMPVARTNNDFGTGVSPIIADGLVILLRDLSKDSQIMAVDVTNGKIVWNKPRPQAVTSYSSPVVWRPVGEEPQVVVAGSLKLQSYRLKDGEELWTIRDMACVPCTSPVIEGDNLIYAGWSPGDDMKPPEYDSLLQDGDADKNGILSKSESVNTFIKDFFDSNDLDKDGDLERKEWDDMLAFLGSGVNRMIAVKPGAHGDATESHVVWERRKGLPYVASALAYDGRVHLVKDGGLASCFNAKTGEPYYEQKRLKATGSYYASPIAAGDRVYMLSLEGKLTTLKAANELEILSTVDLGERASVTPALAGNTILIRTDQHLWAFGSSAP